MKRKATKNRQFNMRVSRTDLRQLDAVAEHYGLNRCALVRFLLKEYERKHPELFRDTA